jgi:hypothetical protein
LDYEVITETSSIDQALCIIISLYVIFELQFGLHNRIVQLLYGILLQEPGALSKPLRRLLNQWNFIIDKKEDKGNTQMVTTASTIDNTLTIPLESQIHVEDSQSIYLPDGEEQEDFTEKSTDLHSVNEEHDLSIFTLLGDNYNSTTTTYIGGKELMKNYSTETSDSSSSIDSPLVIHTSPPEEQQVTTPTSPLLNKNTVCTVNIEHQISSKSTIPKKNISATRKRAASPEEPIALRLKRSRVKKTN